MRTEDGVYAFENSALDDRKGAPGRFFLPGLENEIHRAGPVSYTHLDVYKRQGWDDVLDNIAQSEETGTPCSCKSTGMLSLFDSLNEQEAQVVQ